MEIFQMNDCDWVAAEDLESAKAFYVREHSGGLPEDEAMEEPHQISDYEMGHNRFRLEDSDELRTFRQELIRRIKAGDEFPCFFASTEF